jgi:putative endonuclease
MPFTYMLRCSDGSYYVGSTTNIEVRLAQHQTGAGAVYTRRRRPVELIWFEELSRIDQAFAREKQVQGWSRAKREALIAGTYGTLPGLSANHSRPRRE